ncbi:MAG TPA: TonB-dependent receptor [Terriglobales bacterium]|nr:TonB-dependent receptor [Terriglobales bacterium]
MFLPGMVARVRPVMVELAIFGCLIIPASAASGQQKPPDLTQMSIEDLLNVEVTTASKKEQKLSQTAAAVYVITAEDIARSGLTSIPEVLRLAPGVDVARINSSTWAITIRGFNSEFSNKLLVMIDGRTIYSPNFSGVIWNVEDLPLDDVERIEVIRGPGAAVWGANAVNGVINIITKSADETQGGLITAQAGNYDQGLGTMRYGTRLGGAAVRFSSKYSERGPLAGESGSSSNHDRWDLQRIGFRADWSPSAANGFTFEGDLYESNADFTDYTFSLAPPYNGIINRPWYFSGGSVLARWRHVTDGGSQITGQAFYDRNHEGGLGDFGVTDNTLDLDFQQQAHLGSRHEVVWGLAARVVDEKTNPGAFLVWVPNNKDTKLFSGFAQDEITLAPQRLWLTLGSKIEHNDYTGIEAEPDVRLLWSPHPHHALWFAVSRSIRSPSSLEERTQSILGVLPAEAGLPSLLKSYGSAQFKSETALSYELGYRTQLTQKLFLDLAGFYTNYTRLVGGEVGTPSLVLNSVPPYVLLPINLVNGLQGHGAGAELAINYSLTDFWRLEGSYSWLRLETRANHLHPTATAALPDDLNPQHQFQIHSVLDLRRNVQFDPAAYFVDSLNAPPVIANFPAFKVPRYLRLDARLAWSPVERVELSVVGQNLLRPGQLEFLDVGFPVVSGEARRAFYGKVAWRF